MPEQIKEKIIPQCDYIVPTEQVVAKYKDATSRRDNQYSPPHVREVAGEDAAIFAELLKYREEYGTVQFK